MVMATSTAHNNFFKKHEMFFLLTFAFFDLVISLRILPCQLKECLDHYGFSYNVRNYRNVKTLSSFKLPFECHNSP